MQAICFTFQMLWRYDMQLKEKLRSTELTNPKCSKLDTKDVVGKCGY